MNALLAISPVTSQALNVRPRDQRHLPAESKKFENGKNSIAASQLFRIGQALRVKISTFFEKPAPNRWRMKPR
jgi:hypothetical protein